MTDFSKYKLQDAEYKALDFVNKKIFMPVWNRLESKPRGEDMSRSLKAEVRDPLWMLSRQWQLGEFIGDDAGSTAFTNLSYECTAVGTEKEMPLEVIVEKQKLFNDNDVADRSFDIRIQMANYWLRLLTKSLSRFKSNFISNAKYALPNIVTFSGSLEDKQNISLYTGRSFDGYKFYLDVKRFDNFTGPEKTELQALFTIFNDWYARAYVQPIDASPSHWAEQNLEYRYSISATTSGSNNTAPFNEKSLSVEGYNGGRLDWCDFKLASTKIVPGTPTIKNKIERREYGHNDPNMRKLMPAPVQFDGMPESRYWAFEDGGTNFAAISVDKLDLAKMAIIEFAMIYSNDWAIIPIKALAGSLIDVKILSVVDTFGKTTAIQPINTATSETWKKWSYFSLDPLSKEATKKSDSSLYFPAVIHKSLESKPLEEVSFVRDEMANLVWAIESIIPSAMGEGRDGSQKNKEIVKSKGEILKYQPMTQVPLNWIPFAAMVNDKNKSVLRRGKMLDEQNNAIYPTNSIIRVGLTAKNKVNNPYDIPDYEIGREGVIVRKHFQQTRWVNGEVYTWVAMRKEIGGDGGWSGLAFDQLVNIKEI